MLDVAGVLREVGDVSAARKMVEEAYNKETDLRKKQAAASFRTLLANDVDDKITWLGRSNIEQPSTQADLAAAQGRKASQAGKDDEAANHFRKAIEIYEKMPVNASTLNNGSLSNFQLFRVTQDKADFTRGMDKLDRAIALMPTDSILLANGSYQVIEGALIDTVGTAIDFKVMKLTPGWDALPFLYRGKTERAALVEKFMKHPGSVKGRGYAEKLLTLAPKRASSYAAMSGILEQAHDLDGLKGLLARLEKADLDQGDAARDFRELISGETDAKKIEDAKKASARAETAFNAVKGRKDRTFAYAANRYIHAKIGAATFGVAVDADAMVKLAEEAHAIAESDGTASMLLYTYLYRAHTTLIKQETEYAKLATKTKRSLSTWFVYYIIAENGPLKAKVSANADVKRLADLALAEFKADHDEVGPGTFILLRAVDPDAAKPIAEKAKANERLHVRTKIDRLLAPYSAAAVVSDVWLLRLDGKDDEAKKLLADAVVKGIPLP